MNDTISIIAFILSCISIIGTFWFNRRLLGVRSMANLAHLIQLERGISDTPSAFKFHGISEREIANAGISPDELAYLVASTTAGGVYHRTHSPGVKTAFEPGSYRYTMCMTESFRNAWPLVKRMMNESCFTQRIDKTIESIQKASAGLPKR